MRPSLHFMKIILHPPIEVFLVSLLSAFAPNLWAAPAVVAEPWRVAARDPHSAVWESVHQVTDEVTGATREEKHSYVELATGLHYVNPATGQYELSEEKFVITPQGDAVAAKGQHQLRLAANINAGASVDLVTATGQRIRSNPMGLSFFDSASGRNVLLAEVKDCPGEQIAPNVI